MSTPVTLDTPITVVPAQEAKTSNKFYVTHIEENYGVNLGEEFPSHRAPGRENTVVATVVISTDPYLERRISVWSDEEYVSVRGTWTDQDLYAKIKQILESGQ